MFDALVDWVRTVNRQRIAKRRLHKPVVDTALGFRFSGLKQMLGQDWEAEERRLIQRLFSKTDLFLNVGAHYGYYACLAQQAGLKTIAFEPIPINCQMIAKHIRANGWGPDFTLLPVAAGDESGFIEIQGGGSGGTAVKNLSMAPKRQVQTVPVVRLDDVVALQGRRALVLMDIEGFELAALRGAQGLLAANPKPIWMIEVLSHFGSAEEPKANSEFRDTFAFMKDAGYVAYLAGGQLELVDDKRIEDMAQVRPDQATNFLFVEAGTDLADLLPTEAG